MHTTSCENAKGITPLVETAPIVVFNPISEPLDDGEIIEPSVSEPNATRARLAPIATADPVLDPEGFAVRL